MISKGLKLFSVILLGLALVQACSKSSSPSSPSSPPPPADTSTFTPTGTLPVNTATFTATNTISVVTPLLTSTPTFTVTTATPTLTGSNTPTSTFTPSYTATLSPTSPPTGTFSFTPTSTGTATFSSTSTSTPTSTFTSTTTSTPTWTTTGTQSPTATPTTTGTPTSTDTPTPTATFTPTPNTAIRVAVNSTPTVSASYPVGLHFDQNPNFSGSSGVDGFATSNGAAVVVPVTAGNWYLVAYRNSVGDGSTNGPHVGDPYEIYSNKTLPPGTAIVAGAGVTTDVAVTLTGSRTFPGVTGTVTYSGSGTVSSSNQIRFQAYSDPSYLTPLDLAGKANVQTNASRYDVVTPNSTSVYLLGYFDADGNGSLSPGDPFVVMGYFDGTAAKSRDVTISDSNSWGTQTPNATSPYRLSGSLTYGGSLGTVSAGHPLWLAIFPDNTLNSSSGQYLGINPSSDYLVDLPANQSYYVVAFYSATTPGSNGPSMGDPYISYHVSPGCTIPPDGLAVSGPTTQDFAIIDTCRLTGVQGTASYTGSGTVDNSHRIHLVAYTDNTYTTQVGFKSDVSNSGDPYQLIVPNGATAYQLAYFDADNSGDLSVGDPYLAPGTFTASPNLTRNITFDDSQTWTGYFVQGTVNYTPGSVSASHTLLVHTDSSSTFNGSGSQDATITVNGGYYLASVSGPGTWYMAAVYDASGLGYGGNTGGPHVGDSYQVDNGTCAFPATGLTVSPSATMNWTFGATCQFYGYTGTLTYTGVGTVDNSHRIYVSVYSDSFYASKLTDAKDSSSGTRYDAALLGQTVPSSNYLRAWYDVNGDGTLDAGDLYDNEGLYLSNTGTTAVNFSFSGANTY